MNAVTPYLTFDGNCRQAMTFYAKALGAELQMMPFSEAPIDCPPEAKDRIMHARVSKGAAEFMASDTMPGMPLRPGNHISLAISCESAEETDRIFAALSQSGKVTMPLQETFWAARFGMCTDQFGIQWMLNFEQPKQS